LGPWKGGERGEGEGRRNLGEAELAVMSSALAGAELMAGADGWVATG